MTMQKDCEKVELEVPMSKEGLVEHLTNVGYKARIDEDGVVIVSVAKALNAKEHRKLAKVVHETKYDSSWGWRVEKSKL